LISVDIDDEDDLEEEPLETVDELDYIDEAIDFIFGSRRGTANRPNNSKPKPGNNKPKPGHGRPKPGHGKQMSTLFWCATEVDDTGYVTEWGQCHSRCQADPAGSFLPAAPREKTKNGVVRAKRGQTVGRLVSIIRRRNRFWRNTN